MGISKYLKELSLRLHKQAEVIDEKILQALDAVGSRAVDLAIKTKTYKDNTGNLTASIGYGVYHKGVERHIGGFGGGKGEQEGLNKLASVAAQHRNKSLVLIIVAGMEYALYVERNGYVILDGASVRLDNILREELNKVKVYEV